MVNIKDIARHCGVSISTVSRVMNGHPDVSPEMRQRVQSVIDELDYVPNKSARNLVITQSNTIAVIARGVSNPFFARLTKVIEFKIKERGYAMELHQINSTDDEVRTAVELINEKKLNGVIFLGGRFNYTQADVEKLDVPFVCCTYENSFGDLSEELYSSIAIDDKTEAYNATKYLIDNGHRQIAAIVSSKHDKSISELRFEGYKKALSDAGIEYDERLVEFTGNFDMQPAYDAARRLINKDVSFTAVFTIADAMAIAAMKALSDSGRRVPEDCSVIAIDGIEMSNYIVPTLTTVEQPAEAMGAKSADALIDIIEKKGSNIHESMKTLLREGGSVRKIN